jgi:hypothetical protein
VKSWYKVRQIWVVEGGAIIVIRFGNIDKLNCYATEPFSIVVITLVVYLASKTPVFIFLGKQISSI